MYTEKLHGEKLQSELYRLWTTEEGWTYKKLGENFGLSWKTVRTYLHRERQLLRAIEKAKKQV